MLLTLRIILSIIIIGLAVYSLTTGNYDYSSYITLLLGLMMSVTGLRELQKNRNNYLGFLWIISSLFIFFVAIRGFLQN